MLFKRSFVIHLCCQIIYSVRESNHFPKTLKTKTNFLMFYCALLSFISNTLSIPIWIDKPISTCVMKQISSCSLVRCCLSFQIHFPCPYELTNLFLLVMKQNNFLHVLLCIVSRLSRLFLPSYSAAFFSSLARSRYFLSFLFSFIFTLWSTRTSKSSR